MSINPQVEQPPVNETARIEALSDGIIAIVITLLAFEIGVPNPELLGDAGLFQALVAQWPTYFAFLLSFTIIGIMWSNHHTLFKIIARANPTFVLLNGVLMMTITLIPFATLLLAEYLQHPDRRIAAFLYSTVVFLTAVSFQVLWRYASHNNRLLDLNANPALVAGFAQQYRYGPFYYLATMIFALFNVPLCLGFHVLLAVFFAVPGLVRNPQSAQQGEQIASESARPSDK
jgi:uncharacterized membrane protein